MEFSSTSTFNNFTSPSEYYLHQMHKPVIKKKKTPYRYLPAAAFTGGVLGSLHGVYEKIDFKNKIKTLFKKKDPKQLLKLAILNPDILNKIKLKIALSVENGHSKSLRWKIQDDSDDIIKAFISKIRELIGLPDNSGSEPLFTPDKNSKAAFFKKVLNPVDEYVSQPLTKFKWGKKFVDFMNRSDNTLKSLPFKPNSKFCYNSGLMLKGFAAGAVLISALTALGIELLSNSKKNV